MQRTSEYLQVVCLHNRGNKIFPDNTQTSSNDNVYILYMPSHTFYFVFFSVQNFAPDSITTWEVQAISISPEKGISIGYFLFVSLYGWIQNVYFLK